VDESCDDVCNTHGGTCSKSKMEDVFSLPVGSSEKDDCYSWAQNRASCLAHKEAIEEALGNRFNEFCPEGWRLIRNNDGGWVDIGLHECTPATDSWCPPGQCHLQIYGLRQYTATKELSCSAKSTTMSRICYCAP
jgi:hypothetical protein